MDDLEKKAKKLRRETLRLSLEKNEAHLGGSFSEIEILISLFDRVLQQEDRFILSKGHCSFPYFLLLKERGYSPKIITHPDRDEKNGIYCTTGSLGHGLPQGVGMALARKLQRRRGRIYVLMSDGECNEGTTWESALLAAHHKLDNLTAIIDKNKIQALDETDRVLYLGDLSRKFKEFGWYTLDVDGHNFNEIIPALRSYSYSKPKIIIAHTIKGKGVSFMENEPKWHTRLPTAEESRQAFKELE